MSDPGHDRTSRMKASAALLAGLVLLAFLLTQAARQTRPGPRLSRTDRLVSLIRAEDGRTTRLREEIETLKKQLAGLEAGAAGSEDRLEKIRALIDGLAPYAGLGPVEGPGVRVELRDSTLQDSPTGDPNDLVIHEEDLQAVVNALWAGGAEAITINGERITTLSAIRCVGNTLLLHGSVHSPPYKVAAIGSHARLTAALDADDSVERLRIVAEKFKLGFTVAKAERVSAPAFRGITALRFAKLAG